MQEVCPIPKSVPVISGKCCGTAAEAKVNGKRPLADIEWQASSD
jgi:hypothetical protein